MRRIILVMAVMLVALAASAQRYSGRLETGYQFATGRDAFDQYILNTTHGVNFLDDRLFAGVGIGIGFSRHYRYDMCTLPVYADFRYSFNRFGVKPFFDVRIGYSHIWETEGVMGGEKEKGGIYVAPSIGIAIPVIRRFSLLVSAGYAYSRRSVESSPSIGVPYPIPYSKRTSDIGGWFVTAGIQF